MLNSVTIELPKATYHNLEQIAKREHRPIHALIDSWIAESAFDPALSPELRTELEALHALSTTALVALAQVDDGEQAILRRAVCLEILQKRGYPLDDLLTLPDEIDDIVA